MTEKSQQIEDIQEFEDEPETTEAQEVHQEQDVLDAEEGQQEQEAPETEDIEEAQDEQDDESQKSDGEQPDVSQFDQEITTTVESVVEAVLFASDESLTDARLGSIVETSSSALLTMKSTCWK